VERTERLAPILEGQYEPYLQRIRLAAWERTTAFWPLLEALLPTLLQRRVMTGVDLDQAIGDLEPVLSDEAIAKRAASIVTPEE
jgi:hypothetical protein